MRPFYVGEVIATNKKTSIVLVVLLLMLWASGILMGYGIRKTMAEPIAEAHIATEYVTLPPEIIYERVEIPVEVIKEVEVVKETVRWRNIYDRDFDSVEQFKDWYYAQHFNPLSPSGVYKVDCDDYAQRLQITALRQGYPVSIALLKEGRYYDVNVSDIKEGHAGNLVMIDGTYYYIEPDPSKFSIVKVVSRD